MIPKDNGHLIEIDAIPSILKHNLLTLILFLVEKRFALRKGTIPSKIVSEIVEFHISINLRYIMHMYGQHVQQASSTSLPLTPWKKYRVKASFFFLLEIYWKCAEGLHGTSLIILGYRCNSSLTENGKERTTDCPSFPSVFQRLQLNCISPSISSPISSIESCSCFHNDSVARITTNTALDDTHRFSMYSHPPTP